jgi:outer membrane autotransporter protein
MFDGRYKTSNWASTPTGSLNMTSKGNLESYGGGLFIQYRERLAEAVNSGTFSRWMPGLHLETTARVGISDMDFRSSALNPSIFDTDDTLYYGSSLGGGYVFEPNEKVAVDLYGYGTWVHREGTDVDDNLGQHIEFEDADSFRLISGFRASYEQKENIRPYVGLAVDWETMGESEVRIDSHRTNEAELAGVSGLFELGVGIKTDDNSFLDVRFAGSAGQRDGLGGLMEVRYRF